MKRLKVGLIGLGVFGEIETKILSQISYVEIKALSSRTRSRVESIGKKFGVEKLYVDYKELINDTEIEAIFITSDAKMHYEQAMAAIEAGKHVFVEKPLSLNHQDAFKVAETARKNGIFLMVGYLYRFEICRAMVKKYIDTGKFGNLIYMVFRNSCSRLWFEKGSRYFHPVYETMLHDIDLALWYTQSEVSEIYAREIYTKDNDVPDACLAIVSFANGIVASFETNWLIPNAAPPIASYKNLIES